MGAGKPFNLDLYKKRQAELHTADETGKAEDYLIRIGAITTLFELCESFFFSVLTSVAKDRRLIAFVLSTINSRSVRMQIAEEFLASHAPRQMTKRHAAILEVCARMSQIGERRDEVAHCVLGNWNLDGKHMLILHPAWHIDRKNVAGLPKYHYDIPRLDELYRSLEQLRLDLQTLIEARAHQNLRRLIARQKRADARSARTPGTQD